MIKFVLLFLLFIVFAIFKILFKGVRKTVDVGRNAYDSVKNSNSFEEAYQNFSSDKYTVTHFSVPEEVIALMAKIAKSDGKISDLEIEYMSDTIKSMTQGMQSAGVRSAMIEIAKKQLFHLANTAKKDERPISYYTQSLSKSAYEVRAGAMMQFISFASLDGLSDNTKTMLYEIGTLMQFTHQKVDELMDAVNGQHFGQSYTSAKFEDPYETLGCDKSDDFETIKKAYRKKVRENHPDFMHGQGKSQQEIDDATEQMQKINAAFEEIKRRKA